MRLVTFCQNEDQRLGALVTAGDRTVVIDLSAAWEAMPPTTGGGGSAALPADMLTYLKLGEPAREEAETVIAWVKASVLGEAPEASFLWELPQVQLAAPIPNPGKVIGIGLNYADHAHEQNLEPPPAPILFAKFSTAVIGPGEAITWPKDASSQVDYEAELAVVIGREARQVSARDAYDFIAGYTVANDVSARDAQFTDKQWVRGKSFDTFCPMGPYLLTKDELPEPHGLAIRARLNGQVMQDSRTDQLIFDIPTLIEYISHTTTLLPGDVICTGTPDGVGVFRDPQVFMQPGDEIEIEVERVGVLRNPVR